ncbi:MAG: CDGSH iron-sulfur domain-containing protein [Lentisphaeria bacterium]|nr:CDGSH iron-sulfur domain-containing protein [Candidatus Neomarinimicrobiota bacterium]MCF7842815.1 CDGSH iron-sulfur domain-containing protein [Lentisphaeria bacterium]
MATTEPKVAQRGPYKMKVEAKTYAWCACGRSENQPFCDGSHKITDIKPIIQRFAEAREVSWCGCKHSGTKPFCDGTHRKV